MAIGRSVILGLAACVAVPALALAQTVDFVAPLLAQLQQQGYRTVVAERTLLNRERIVAENGRYRREIVVDPRTGEILRDYRQSLPDEVSRGADRGIVAAGEDSVHEPEGEAPDRAEPDEESESEEQDLDE